MIFGLIQIVIIIVAFSIGFKKYKSKSKLFSFINAISFTFFALLITSLVRLIIKFYSK